MDSFEALGFHAVVLVNVYKWSTSTDFTENLCVCECVCGVREIAREWESERASKQERTERVATSTFLGNICGAEYVLFKKWSYTCVKKSQENFGLSNSKWSTDACEQINF